MPLRSASGMDAYMQVHQMGWRREKTQWGKRQECGRDIDAQQGEPTTFDVENKQQNIQTVEQPVRSWGQVLEGHKTWRE